jgi:hypothetical protein
VPELDEQFRDVVPLPPAVFAVTLALAGRVGGEPAEPLGQPVEQGGDVVEELGAGEPVRVGHLAVPFDARPPVREDGVALPVEVVRQHGGLGHRLVPLRT